MRAAMQRAAASQRTWLDVVRDGASLVARPGRRLLRLDANRMLVTASRRTGLHDFGDPAFHEPLERLLRSLEAEACLNLVGRIAALGDLTGMLMNRLRLERDRAQHPGIAREQIRRPLIITGLPRSGSTFLHGLLAQDPASRVPLHWELRFPSPPPERSSHDTDPRIERAARHIRWFFRLAPEFRKIHPVGARLPEECVIILSHSFLSFEFSSNWFVPSYQTWLEQQELEPAYRYHRRFLQHLQWGYPVERWLLKAPPHLPGLRALFAVYPDADVIVTHRDPLEVVPSIASLHVVLRRTFSRAVDPLAVGPEVSRMLADDIRRGFAARDDGCAPPERFLDVWYTQLMDDPLAVVRRIYRHFDLPLSAEVEGRMRTYLETNPKDRAGPHRYSLAEFGLDAEVERARYREYWDRWHTPRS
ncbi:MAG TPA: sulfotransferase [Candidatus Binatus sp.]|nr:sulfotransferase [Candidatus Binatus sp.]